MPLLNINDGMVINRLARIAEKHGIPVTHEGMISDYTSIIEWLLAQQERADLLSEIPDITEGSRAPTG